MWADAAELKRLRRLRAFEIKHHGRRTPSAELTTRARRTQSSGPTTRCAVEGNDASFNTVGLQTVNAADNQASQLNRTSVTVLPAKVQGVQENDGSIQRSKVVSLTVTFNTVMTFADPNNVAAAFQLTRNGGGAVGSFTASASVTGGVTVVTLTNFTGAETDFGSLADGVYTLRVLANQVAAGGVQARRRRRRDRRRRLRPGRDEGQRPVPTYADVNGDGVVDSIDLGQFRSTFNSNSSQASYLWYLDEDNSGAVDATDLGAFRSRYNVTVFP